MGDPGNFSRRQFLAGVSLGALAGFGAGVTVTRRPLLIGGGGSFTRPDPVGFTLTSAPDGGWPGQQCSNAYQFNGVVYVGYVDSSGNVEIVTYDEATGVVSSPFVLRAAFDVDWHTAPAVLVRTDGHIVVAYCKHINGDQMYVRISTNPEDISAWGTETNIDAQLGGLGEYTYPNLTQLTGESGDPLYLFYRQRLNGGATGSWCLAKSTDGGASWGTQVVVYKETGFFSYGHMNSDGDTRLDFAFTKGTGAADNASIYHCYRVGTSYFKSDGSSAGSPTLDVSDMTLIYDGSATGVRYAASVKRYGSRVFVTFPDQVTGDTDQYYCVYDGSWTCHLVASDGATGEAWVEGGLVVDQVDPAYAYLSRYSGGAYQVFRYHTADLGASWDSVQLATSPSDDFYPIAVRNADRLRVLWMRGTASDYETYSLGIMAATR